MKKYAFAGLAALFLNVAAPALANGIATCDAPAEQIVPSEWQPFSAEGPIVPIPHFLGGNFNRQIDFVREGQLFVDRRGDLIELGNVDWSTNNHNYFSTQLHALVGIGTLFSAGEKLPDDIEEAAAIHILNWAYCVANAPYHENERAWYEGTVIKRQSNLLHTLNYIRQHGDLPHLDLTTLLYLIDGSVNYLLDTPGVYSLDNHGIRQDMLLAATALSFPEHPRTDEMLELAEERLEKAADALFTEEGIWAEHAPGYVHYALRLMGEIRALNKASNRFNPRLFLSRYDSSSDYLLASLLPDGLIPYIGASGAERVRGDIADEESIAAALGRMGRTLSAFPDYGHAIVRGDLADGLYLLFVANQRLPAGKRHADELSFLLYNNGRPWISEGGHQSYEMSGMNRYLTSPFSHNTYTLNGQYVAWDERPDLATELVSATKDGDLIRLHGRSERFPQDHGRGRTSSILKSLWGSPTNGAGSTFERLIEINDYSALTITDMLRGDGAWVGRFQIPGDLTVNVDGMTVTAIEESGRTMVLDFASNAPLTFSTCYGEVEPICGWASSGHDFGPATTLMWSFEGDAEVTIEIEWNYDGA